MAVETAKTHFFPCAQCGEDVSQREIELDADCRVVCMECYLADPPEEDVACALLEIEWRLTK